MDEQFDPNWRNSFPEEDRKFFRSVTKETFTNRKIPVHGKRYFRKKDGKDILHIMGPHMWYWGEVLDEDEDIVVTLQPGWRGPTEQERRTCEAWPMMQHMAGWEVQTGSLVIGYHPKVFIEDHRFLKQDEPVTDNELKGMTDTLRKAGYMGITMAAWLAKQNFCPATIIAKKIRETEKAIYVEDVGGRKMWLPKSQIKMVE